MEDNPLLKKIEEAKGKYRDARDQNILVGWEKSVKKALLINSLKNHDGIKIVLDTFTEDIKGMNEILLQDRKLTDQERLRLLDQRGMYEKFVKIFADCDQVLQSVEKELENPVV